MTFEDVQISGPKMLSVKVLVWFFAAGKMQLFSKHIFDNFGVKIIILINITPFIQFAPLNSHFGIKMMILTKQMIKNVF